MENADRHRHLDLARDLPGLLDGDLDVHVLDLHDRHLNLHLLRHGHVAVLRYRDLMPPVIATWDPPSF